MSNRANPVEGSITVISAVTMEGNLWIEVPCADYDVFSALPAAIEYCGKVCGKTGWNSDRCVAYFSSGRKVATAVK